jgi:hypothetical protein
VIVFVAVALAFASGRANAGSSARSSGPQPVLFAGGIKTMKVAGIITLSSAELFEPNRGSFIATGSMSVARTGHTATRLKKREHSDRRRVQSILGRRHNFWHCGTL